jgi:hypothetical protein
MLDNRLGKEFLDYDLFVEKFKKTYAFKYAPALNDEKFLGQYLKSLMVLILMMLVHYKDFILELLQLLVQVKLKLTKD